jgi:hypothetical protein
MSKKDVINYYEEVCDQYHQFLEELKDFEKECSEGLVGPERLEAVKTLIAPLKNNWQTLNYIIFLLNKPVKKKKHKVYINQNKKLLDQCKTKEQVLAENDQCIENMRNN